MDLTILVVGLILGVGIPLRNKAIKKRRENMKEKGNEFTGLYRGMADFHAFVREKIGNCLFGFEGRREKKLYICVMNKGKCVRYR